MNDQRLAQRAEDIEVNMAEGGASEKLCPECGVPMHLTQSPYDDDITWMCPQCLEI